MAGEPPPARLDLSSPRTYLELLTATFEVVARHSAVLLTAALVLITPVALLVDGVWGRALADGPRARPPTGAEAASLGLRVFLVLPVMSAIGAVAVQTLGGGRAPTLGGALRAVAARLPALLGAVILYVTGVAVGTALFVVPGIWVLVLWYFAAQAVVIDGLGPRDALRASTDLVRGRWWHTAGVLLATGLLFGVGGSVVIGLIGATGSTALYVAGLIVVEGTVAALTAVFVALLFFDLRVRGRRPGAGGL